MWEFKGVTCCVVIILVLLVSGPLDLHQVPFAHVIAILLSLHGRLTSWFVLSVFFSSLFLKENTFFSAIDYMHCRF